MQKKSSTIYICLTGDLSIDNRVHKTATTLISEGFSVKCLTRKRNDFGIPTNQPYSTQVIPTLFKTGALFYAEFNIKLLIWLLLKPKGIILSIDLDTLMGCFFASCFRRHALVFDSHEYFPEVPELAHRPRIKNAWIKIEKSLLPRLTHCYTVCDSIADIYKEKYGASFKVVRNLPLKNTSETGVAKYKANPFTLLYQGAVNKGRAIKEVIEAMPHLNDVKLIIAGYGDEFDEIKELIESKKLTDKVTLVGKVPFNELINYTKNAQLGLCLLENIGLNYYYALPNRLFDYAKVGLPVLTSSFPEIKSIIDKHQTGIMIDDLNTQTIVQAIQEIQYNESRWTQLSEQSLKMAETMIWENDAPVFIEMFEKLRRV